MSGWCVCACLHTPARLPAYPRPPACLPPSAWPECLRLTTCPPHLPRSIPSIPCTRYSSPMAVAALASIRPRSMARNLLKAGGRGRGRGAGVGYGRQYSACIHKGTRNSPGMHTGGSAAHACIWGGSAAHARIREAVRPTHAYGWQCGPRMHTGGSAAHACIRVAVRPMHAYRRQCGSCTQTGGSTAHAHVRDTAHACMWGAVRYMHAEGRKYGGTEHARHCRVGGPPPHLPHPLSPHL